MINKTRHVDNETKHAVLEAIKRFEYKAPSTHQKKSPSKISKTIGIVIADIREDFFSDLIKHTESMVRNMGYNVLFCDSEQNALTELSCIKLLLKSNIDGLILAPADTSTEYPILKEQNIPTVLVDRNIDNGDLDFVGIDNFRSTLEATQKLIRLNVKNIAFIGYSEINYTIKERKAGYKTAMLEAGIFNHKNTLQVSYHNQAENNQSIYEFIKMNPDLEGVVCGSTVICHETIGSIYDTS